MAIVTGATLAKTTMNIIRVRYKQVLLVILGILCGICLTSLVYVRDRTPFQASFGKLSRDKGIRKFSHYNLNALKDEIPPFNLSSRIEKLPIVIVEEHHEVIPHWYSAAKAGIISAKGNTLIHIDGHSDAAPPIFLKGYPNDFYPRTRKEIKRMMQRNDAFVMEAALSGLVSRYIWIWPKWDGKNHDTSYEAYYTLLGVVDTVYKNLDYAHIKSCCICAADKDMNPLECSFLNITADNPQDEDSGKMNIKDCKIKAGMAHQIIREDLALEMARNGSLFEDMTESEKAKVLLDIDEDFYGCESGVQPILDENLSMGTVKNINKLVDRLFCPATTKEETMLDKILSDVINDIVSVKKCNDTCPTGIKASLPKYTSKISDNTELNQTMCSRYKKMRPRLWRALFKLFNSMTTNQLKQLKEVGFCFRTTPKANDFGDVEEPVFRVCHGANTPGDSVVIYHTPSLRETMARTQLLEDLFKSTQKVLDPAFVTVCRSMRDGYTPKKQFRQIEDDVLFALQFSFLRTEIHYDPDLMGGKRGWPGRHG